MKSVYRYTESILLIFILTVQGRRDEHFTLAQQWTKRQGFCCGPVQFCALFQFLQPCLWHIKTFVQVCSNQLDCINSLQRNLILKSHSQTLSVLQMFLLLHNTCIKVKPLNCHFAFSFFFFFTKGHKTAQNGGKDQARCSFNTCTCVFLRWLCNWISSGMSTDLAPTNCSRGIATPVSQNETLFWGSTRSPQRPWRLVGGGL